MSAVIAVRAGRLFTRTSAVRLIAAIVTISATAAASAQDSRLDRSFGASSSRGRAIVAFDLADGNKRDVGRVIFPNGDTYIVAGRVAPSAPGEIHLGFAELSPLGAVGVRHTVLTSLSDPLLATPELAGTGIARDAQGRFYAMGTVMTGNQNVDISRMAVTRIRPDYTVDTTYGTGGTSLVDMSFSTAGSRAEALDLHVAPDGTATIAGFAADLRTTNALTATQAIVRLRPDGTRDFGFAGDGIANVAFDLPTIPVAVAARVTVDAQGRTVIAGLAEDDDVTGTVPTVARLLPNGAIDESFCPTASVCDSIAFGGKRFLSFGSTSSVDGIRSLAPRPDGSIIVLGHHAENGRTTCVIAKLKADGSADQSFGTAGQTVLDFDGTACIPAKVLVDAEGFITVVGHDVATDTSGGVFLARLKPNGRLDTTFAPNSGIASGSAVRIVFPSGAINEATASDAFIDANGRLLAIGSRRTSGAGGSSTDDNLDFAILRTTNGVLQKDSFE